MDTYQIMQNHFRRIAPVYNDVRNTDPDVIEVILSYLRQGDHVVNVAEIGCGTGRYSRIIVARLNQRLNFFCCDLSETMLEKCCELMYREFPSSHIHYCLASANNLPFSNNTLDAIITFNAIHHYDLKRFVSSSAHILRPGSLLAIYTRTPEQNARTVWGQYFPKFNECENRLYRCEVIEEVISETPRLKLVGLINFRHFRAESVESLLNQARHFHYSTFALYPPGEFAQAMSTFSKRLSDLKRNGTIGHTAENTLILARRTTERIFDTINPPFSPTYQRKPENILEKVHS
jgi:SAM-dependent methyltransferase